MNDTKNKRRLRFTRDGILFTVGLLGIVYETLYSGLERPTLLILFAGMIGLPAFIQKDEKAQGQDNELKS